VYTWLLLLLHELGGSSVFVRLFCILHGLVALARLRTCMILGHMCSLRLGSIFGWPLFALGDD
jgi:hypothetical protein